MKSWLALFLVAFLSQNTFAQELRCHLFDYGTDTTVSTRYYRRCAKQLDSATGEKWLQVKFEQDLKDESYLYLTFTRSIESPSSNDVLYSIKLLKGRNGPPTHRIQLTIEWRFNFFSSNIKARAATAMLSPRGDDTFPWCGKPSQTNDGTYLIIKLRCHAKAYKDLNLDFPAQSFQIEFTPADGTYGLGVMKSKTFTLFGRPEPTTTTTTTTTTAATTVSTTKRRRTRTPKTKATTMKTSTKKTTTTSGSIETSTDDELKPDDDDPIASVTKKRHNLGSSSDILKLVLRIVAAILVLVLLLMTVILAYTFFQHPSAMYDD